MSRWISPEEGAKAMDQGRGRGVKIAVLDSGVEIGHPDFLGRKLRDDFVLEVDHQDPFQPGNGRDLYGHGTAIAGIIWSLAPEAEIGSLRILGPNLGARTAQVSLAANRAMELGYDVLNCSFGCSILGHLPLYKAWVDRAELCGVHVIAASGSHDPRQPEWPAHFPSVLGVDASRTAESEITRCQGRVVEFTAPGSNRKVPWKDGTHRIMTGSSFAAAYLTGMVARLLSVHPSRDPLFLKALLRKIARCEK